MICYCICDRGCKEKLQEDFSKNFKGYGFCIRDSISDTKQEIDNGDIIVIEHENVCKCKELLTEFEDILYVYYDGRFFSAKDEEKYLKLKEEMLQRENWNGVKKINDILLDFDFIKRRSESVGLPDYIQIETTNKCNAECIMCSHYFSKNKNTTSLQNETLLNMTDALIHSRTVSLNGMGEPFISPYVCDQIDVYSKYGNKMVTNTNLSYLNDRLVTQIRDNFEWLEISCDGAGKDVYENIRINLSFDNFKTNLKILQEKCPDVRKHIAFVIMRQNVHQMPDMVKMASEFGVSIVTFMTLNANIVISNSNDEMHKYPKVLEYFSVAALKEGKKCGMPVIVPNAHMLNHDIQWEDVKEEYKRMTSFPMYKSDAEVQIMYKIADLVEKYLESNDETQRDTKASNVRCKGICDWILKRSYVDLNGNTCMCCRNQSFQTGNVNEGGSFSAVWNSDFYKKLRGIFYSGYVPESCLKCGIIESGNLKFLEVSISDEFYEDPQYKKEQKIKLKKMVEEIM